MPKFRGATGGTPCPNLRGHRGTPTPRGGHREHLLPKTGGGHGASLCQGTRVPPGVTPVPPQAAEQGHRELCALLLRQRPALAALRDARGRSPRDGAHPAVWDLLDT